MRWQWCVADWKQPQKIWLVSLNVTDKSFLHSLFLVLSTIIQGLITGWIWEKNLVHSMRQFRVRAHRPHRRENINPNTRLKQIFLPCSQVHSEGILPAQNIPHIQAGKENQAVTIPGKHSLVMNLQKTVAAKGSPDVLAPGKWYNLKNGLSQAAIGRRRASPQCQALRQCFKTCREPFIVQFVFKITQSEPIILALSVPGELAVCRSTYL